MRVLVVGGGGMLGHKMYQIISKEYDTYVTFRNFNDQLKSTNIFNADKVLNQADVLNYSIIEKIIASIKPEIIINCVGVIKQLKEANDAKQMIYINSLFPHLLAESCNKNNCRLIHISTDCVFSGKKGNYNEDDFADAYDLYGRTKYLGELDYKNTLTLRTSIIGHELFSKVSLVDWFLSNKNGKVKGFKNAIYSGLPTLVLVKELLRIIKDYPTLSGLYNVSSNKISKYDLLLLINKIYNSNILIEPDEIFSTDKSLECKKYIQKTNYNIQCWEKMIKAMHEDFIENNYQGLKNV